MESVTKIIEEVIAEVCDKICRYAISAPPSDLPTFCPRPKPANP